MGSGAALRRRRRTLPMQCDTASHATADCLPACHPPAALPSMRPPYPPTHLRRRLHRRLASLDGTEALATVAAAAAAAAAALELLGAAPGIRFLACGRTRRDPRCDDMAPAGRSNLGAKASLPSLQQRSQPSRPHSPLGLFSTSTSMTALAALLLPPLPPPLLLPPAMAACDAVKLERRYTCGAVRPQREQNTHTQT